MQILLHVLLLATAAEPSTAQRLAEVSRVYADEAALPARLKANLAEKKSITESLQQLEVELTRHVKEQEASRIGCEGPFADEAAKTAHLAVCEPRQKELAAAGEALARRKAELDRRDTKRQTEAKRLSAAHKAAPAHIAELQASLRIRGELAGTCSGEPEGRPLHDCWLGVWESLQRPVPAAAALLEAFDDVSRTFTRPGRNGTGLKKGPIADPAQETNNCQHFFRAMATHREKEGLDTWASEFDGMNASAIAAELARVSADSDPRWRALGANDAAAWSKAQSLANRGAIVVGAMQGSPHGHLGFVYPVSPALDASQFVGKGPFVRDGNEHVRTAAATTWGAVEASRAFDLSKTTWYVFVPSSPD